MPETASPANVLPKSDPDAIKDENAPEAHVNGDDALNGMTNGHDETNGDAPESQPNGHVHDDERPAKRRRTRESTPPRTPKKIKPESPPWKKISADGPTSFTENGRRKSGRINTLPIESNTKTRSTRRSGANSNASKPKAEIQLTNGNSRKMPNGSHKASPATKAPSKQTPASTPKSSKKPTETRPSRSTRRRSPSPQKASTRSRRSARFSDVKDDIQESKNVTNRSPRIKLRVGRSGDIPLVHPDQVRKKPKIGTNFEDFWARAGDIPVEEGGLQASEDGPPYTDEMAAKDARTILRIEQEVEDGGLLSQGRCSVFLPEAEEEPPRQWARQDHMVKAMTNFRKLMLAEQQRHRLTAKKLAEACRDEWLRRQPKSEEEIEAEQRAIWISRYRVVMKALFGTWENVRVEVNRRRLAEWEQEEQKRVKAALNEAVNLSEQKLQARRAGLDSEQLSEEEGDGFDDLSDDMSMDDDDDDLDLASGEDGDNEDDPDSDIMSSDEEEGDEEEDLKDVGDENLTQEQLQAKYAHIPELEKPDAETPITEPSRDDTDAVDTAQATATENADTSDESVDMDDDMGSTDMDSDEEGDDESEEESDEDAGGGLLGLLFGKSELKKMNDEAATEGPTENGDTEMADAEESTPKVNGVVQDEGTSVEKHNAIENEGAADIAQKQTSTPTLETNAPDAATKAVPVDGDTVTEAPVAEGFTSQDTEVVMTEATQEQESAPTLPSENNRSTSEQPTNPPSRAHSMSPPPTSETKPSELDTASSGEMMVVDKTGPSRSASPQQSSNHKIDVPFLLRGTLREYQRDGLDWLAGLYANSTNGILADEMGLGKTIQTIALLAHLACQHEVWGPHLVVVPTSVMLNWEMEFKKWCPGFKILAYYGSQEERKRKRQGWNNDDVWNVCITSYQLVLQDQQVFKRRRWHYMILDEAHNIKNFKSQRWQTLLGFNTQARLLLTGTPLQNNLTELWSLLFFLMPAENGVGGFADLQEFHDWFAKPESQILESGREQMDDEARAIISKLHKVLRPYLLRRLKADVEKQMPAKYEHVEFCRLSKRQRELYDGFLSRNDTKETLNSGNYLSIINCLMQLRKVCNHPDLFVDRPIMTSFRMSKSVVSDYDFIEQRIQKLLLDPKPMKDVSLGFLNLIPTQSETLSTTQAERISQLSSHRILMDLKEAQRTRAHQANDHLDPSTVASNIAYLESGARWGRFEELQHCVYLNALRRQKKPIYGKNLVELLTIGTDKRPYKPRPKVPRLVMSWFEEESRLIQSMIPTVNQRADSFKTTIEKFSCVTPAVVTRDMDQFVLGRKGIEAFTDEDLKLSKPVRWAPFLPKEAPPDPWHEGRMRLSIQFPDKRLLQYDCGKLQVLDKLLRKLQTGGHRALIFTQMTKVLDILEQFLNIHGHKYLRLDGATKVEQRQILTDRFNNDPRILCFILSTRSGGLGINLTGADTVIFYDQDWNPAMDKQCQDRCHRIGQTRDVHIYRLVSEHTIEANILRKASQKQMLDDVVIQEGEFTTDYFNKLSVRDVLSDKLDTKSEGLDAADAALDRVLGGPDTNTDQRRVGRALEQAEDREDVAAARVAEKEIQADDADFTEKPSNNASGTSTARQGTPAGKSVLDGGLDDLDTPQLEEELEYNAWGHKMHTIDDYMLSIMAEQLKDTKLELPKDKKKGKKKGKDTRKR
ncbi:SNF2 family N-terminal domain-containing protein [Fusarium oxysporum Fo47]|uniref:DNA helicase n=1 Tax=Fusarium oxysporum Fo47 TaxID=660027 RepID=W9KI77_FUSOX|nr:SNF2 family N-terminal domain-containing protein [Fusarium oxysporum Fo47]EWZ40992.1 adenosinetriphosphatase [Fusarium oxysporum Fo47]EWZ40993.1 adenosinetriphosphatase [Fusarium oxysporum Fo47]WJG35104.1 SNF2 family N-terminal domain-domain-containing protein [Fusarium oxysporum Fo47]